MRPQAFNFIKNETPKRVFSCEFCEIFDNTYFATGQLHKQKISKSTKARLPDMAKLNLGIILTYFFSGSSIYQKKFTKVVVTWSRLAVMKFCPALPGSQQSYKLFIKYFLRLHINFFIPARQDFSFVQPGSHLGTMKFFHATASACLSRIKKLIKKYP